MVPQFLLFGFADIVGDKGDGFRPRRHLAQKELSAVNIQGVGVDFAFGRGFFDHGGAFGQRVKIDRRDRTAARCRLAVCKSSRAASAAAAPAGFGARSAPQAATPFGLAFGKIGRPAAPGYPIRPGLLLLSGPFI